jgi:alpha-galactosidase
MLCPALPQVQAYTRDLTIRFIRDWGFDGHKLDNIYTMPACYNPAHRHAYPEESIAAFAQIYQIILNTTLQIKPNAVTQICPCGTPLTHSLIPFTNQPVTADPTTSLQIRQRIKFYKGLMGPQTAVFADHVELSDASRDFSSEIGTGGVPATKFTFPEDEDLKQVLLERYNEYWALSPEKQAIWKKWLDLYNKDRLSEAEYLNLYDLAFDTPEAHVILKGEDLFYAFYAPDFSGEIELRGLGQHNYRLVNSVTGEQFGIYSGNNFRVSATFSGSLLLHAIRVK